MPKKSTKKKSASKFSPEYLAYLESPQWQERRKRIFKRDGNRCVGCHSTNRLQCHHRVYPARGASFKDFVEQDDAEFSTLCPSCHTALTKSIRSRRKKK